MLLGCKKKNSIDHTIKGKVVNLSTGGAVSNAEVDLKARIIAGGVYNLNLVSIGKSSSNGSGDYVIDFERKNTEEYELHVSGTNFFPQIVVVSTDAMYSSNPKDYQIGVYTSSSVEVRFKNADLESDSSAVFSYAYQGPEQNCECCPKSVITKIGEVDTTFQCSTYGDRYFKYGYTVKRVNQTIVVKNDSVFCEAGKLAKIEIFY